MTDAITRLNAALEGRYAIERMIGEGGMATVYLARDLRHNRSVALKVLKPELAAVVGAERFLTEIETTANLQHPHILPLYDSGQAESFLFYVMPYVQGETLRERLDREKQLPVDEAVRIATAVAGALDYAHRHGVVHRDIKPGNILMQDGQPVVGDFGIALAVGSAGGARLTETGLSVGTPFYMSPEQATGDQGVGPASDIYALGCVLYEMLVGDPPFMGSTAQAVLGQIIAGASVSATQKRKSIPLHVDAAIRKALEKLPADRFTSAADFAKALNDSAYRYGALDVTHAADVGSWRRLAFVFAGTAAVLAVLAGWALTRAAPPAPVHRVSVVLPEPRGGTTGSIALSDDGRLMVYEGPTGEGGSQLWVRRWSELHATPVGGTSNALEPSISPDGSEVVFMENGAFPRRLLVASLAGGVPRVVTESALASPYWGRDGFIYFTDAETLGVSRVPAAGGPKESLTTGPSQRERSDSAGPHFDARLIGDGPAFLLTVDFASRPELHVFDPSVDEIVSLGLPGFIPQVTRSGHLVYMTEAGEIMAAPFDAEALETTGPAVPIIRGGDRNYADGIALALSGNGTLAYVTGSGSNRYQPVWVDRNGAATPIDPDWSYDPGGNNRGLALSPEGDRLAVAVLEADADAEDIWIKELPRGPLTRLTVDPAQDVRPRWTRDGRVTFVTEREGRTADIFVQRADGTGGAEPLLTSDVPLWEGLLSRDGGWVVARTGGEQGATGGRDVLAFRPGQDTVPIPLIVTDFDEKAVTLSPDGAWLAYESDETGQNEIYVRPFPNVDGGKWAVSVGGGVMPLWSNGGGEIFYVNRNRDMVSAVVDTEAGFRVRDRTPLFTVGPDYLITQFEQYTLYDVTPDDHRFVMLREVTSSEAELILVQNWFEELKRLVPAP
jgi:serine/threonine-protein kinase